MKINANYKSIFEFLVEKNFLFFRRLDEKFFPYENSTLRYGNDIPYRRRWNIKEYNRVLGAFQPIVNMGKDFINTFLPYKSHWHVIHSFLQPIRGLGNIGRGIGTLIIALFIFIYKSISYIFTSPQGEIINNEKIGLRRTASWLLDGISSLVRGSTQILFTPLTWFIQIPLRGIITKLRGVPKIEDNKSLQKLVTEGIKIVKKQPCYIDDIITLDCIICECHRKFLKSLQHRQGTDINKENEEQLFNQARLPRYGSNYISGTIDKSHILNYFALFNINALNLNAEKEAFLCGLHPRLGTRSPVSTLPPEIARHILDLATHKL